MRKHVDYVTQKCIGKNSIHLSRAFNTKNIHSVKVKFH